MTTTFIFDKEVTGRNFVGRRQELALLKNFVFSGECVAVYGEPGCGKMSLIRQMLTGASMDGERFCTADISLMRCRTLEDVLTTFASGVIKAVASTPAQFREILKNHLEGTHLVFDDELYGSTGMVLSSNWMLDEVDARKVFMLPSALAAAYNTRIVVLVDEFQSILLPEESHMLLSLLQEIVEAGVRRAPFIFTGSRYNAMREIFDQKRWFWRTVERMVPAPHSPSEISEFVFRGFQNQGKVLEREDVLKAAQTLRCNMRYVCHLFNIVDSMCRGFVGKNAVRDAMSTLLSIHTPRFYSIVCSLTDFQLNLLRAIVDGEVKFSSVGVIDRYRLNSSANVKRLKDALVKKEVVWFDDHDEPHIVDPLFEYWLRAVYFA